MSVFQTTSDLPSVMKGAIEEALPGAEVEVAGSGGHGGHFTIRVVSEAFEGKGLVQRQRLVYRAIGHLMKGDNAPVHAIDRLETIVPTS